VTPGRNLRAQNIDCVIGRMVEHAKISEFQTRHRSFLVVLPFADDRELILNYFRVRKQLSGGVVESLNNKAKLTMRKAYEFPTFRITEIALYHALGKLPEPYATYRFY
jgi:hypothetical protein